MSDPIVAVTETGSTVNVLPEERIVSVASPGPQGPAGIQGPTGPPGGASIVHEQSSPAASWNIVHNYGRPVSVTLLDPNGNEVETDVDQSDPNVLVVVFPGPTTGKALVL